jgi:hypothetical protein
MPFTPSHLVAILPLVRTPLPAAGLAIGSMVPDLPYFVPIGIPRGYSHSLIGALTADLPMAIVTFLLWIFVLRAPLLDFAPVWLHDRFRVKARTGSPLGFVALLVAAILIGIATHLIWDSFTHPDGGVVVHVSALRDQIGPFAVSRWLQYLSSVGGLIILAIWTVRWARRTPGETTRYQRTGAAMRVGAWSVVIAVLAAVAGTIWIRGIVHGVAPFDRELVYDTAVYSIAAAGLLAVVVCLIWYLFPRRAQP